MPQADFTSDYSSTAGRSNFPRLRLQKNEIARVCIVSKPRFEFVHWLEAPQIVNMSPTYKTITTRDGAEMNVVNTRKVNQPICHGTSEILKERGVDAENCLACLMARDRPDIFRPPSPRYALNIIRYGLRPGGGWQDISMPFSIGSLLWAFSGKVMDKLIAFRSMGAQYEDLRMVDLLLACEDQNFQKPYSQGEFTPIAPAVWTMSDELRKHTVVYLEQNHATDEDLDEAIGKRVNDNWLSDDIRRVIQGWDVVRAFEARGSGGPNLGQGFGTESFQSGMAAVQQQFGQQPNGNGFQPQQQFNPPPPPQQQSSGAQQSANGYVAPEQLWEPQWQQPAASPPAQSFTAPVPDALSQAAAPELAALQAEQMAKLQAGGVPAEMLQQAQAPLTPSQQPGPPQQPPANPSAVPQSPQPVQRPEQAAQPMQPPPSGLDGLNEFMRTTTSNPAPGPIPPLPPGAGQAAAAPPPGGHYSFEDLVQLGKSS